MFTKGWGMESLRRCRLKSRLAAATMLAGALLLPAAASAQSPPNCNANVFNVTIAGSTLATVPGDTVEFTLRVENPAVVGGQIGCDATSVDVTFFCPAADGTPDLANPITVVTNQNYPAGTTSTIVGTFTCVMPDPPSGLATARVVASGDLQSLDPTPFTISRDLTVTIQSCLVKVDKQVSCDGGVTWVDATLVFANEDGTLSCNGINATPPAILARYRVQNAGETQLFQCVLTETNTAFGSVSVPTPIPVATTTGFLPAPGQPLCSDALDANEPNTANVNCFCTADLDPNLKTSASDSANINCQQVASLSVVKQCVDANSDGTDEITITVTAGAGDLGFTSCAVTDSIFLDDPTCPANVGAGTSVTVAPASFALAPATSQVVTGMVTLSADACNTVAVSCVQAGTGAKVVAEDDTVCPGQGEGCLTRTPGFWGNHPAITAQFLPVEICGVTLDTTDAGSTTSATEAICSVGRDHTVLGPQLTQLVRQCTAAALNIAASIEGGGNCSTTFPNLTEQFAACCGDESICTGDEVEDFTIESCIETLDSFNNSIDTLEPFGDFLSPGPANPRICMAARNNGVVVTPIP
jgi:hypothetical protein